MPASFDEEARELTVKAARDAGFQKLTLLEEPLAAFYAWIVARRRSLKRYLKDGDLVLICDVGGGTTDFSLIRVQIVSGEIKFERIAIGEHLLLGGDNVDLALARRVMEKLGNPKLSLRQQNALRRQCCAAKEKLLSDGRLKRVPVNILGAGARSSAERSARNLLGRKSKRRLSMVSSHSPILATCPRANAEPACANSACPTPASRPSPNISPHS